jgi:hypothetical protein
MFNKKNPTTTNVQQGKLNFFPLTRRNTRDNLLHKTIIFSSEPQILIITEEKKINQPRPRSQRWPQRQSTVETKTKV